jgi:predicted metal-dependent phosphoesterase TrpH
MNNRSPEIYFDAVETFNPSYAGRISEAKVRRLNRERYNLPEVGNSDSHHLEGVGSAYTVFDGRNAADYRAALTAISTTPGGVHWDLGTHAEVARRKFASFRGNLRQGPRHMLRRLRTDDA